MAAIVPLFLAVAFLFVLFALAFSALSILITLPALAFLPLIPLSVPASAVSLVVAGGFRLTCALWSWLSRLIRFDAYIAWLMDAMDHGFDWFEARLLDPLMTLVEAVADWTAARFAGLCGDTDCGCG